MSRRQCCIWGCHNMYRKGRCTKDIAGNRLCSCPVLKARHCLKLELLSLHSIHSIPEYIKQAVVTKINFTRQGPKGKRWQPSKGAVICNVHYLDYKGPSKANQQPIPIYFKRQNSHPTPPTTK